MPPSFSLQVAHEDSGARLDAFVAGKLDGVSRSRVHKLIVSGAILVNGRSALPRSQLDEGDAVTGVVEAVPAWDVSPEDISLDVVYEDEHLAIINKPRGLAVHPGAGRPSGTLVNALAARYGTLPEASGPERPGIVHRLDKDTSGLMVVALTADAMTRLAAMVADREVERRYKVLAWGNPRFSQCVVDAAIGRDPRHPEKMAVLPQVGPNKSRSAVTEFAVLEVYEDAVLMEAKLQTGRTHQIRVHSSYAGHDVIGDPVYGHRHQLSPGYSLAEKEEFRQMVDDLAGQALHAWALSFRHPVSNEAMSFTAECPGPMLSLVELLRRHNRTER